MLTMLGYFLQYRIPNRPKRSEMPLSYVRTEKNAGDIFA